MIQAAAATAGQGMQQLLSGEIFNKLIASLNEVPNKIKSFVEAFSPASVEAFNRAMRDLLSTVGVALQPVMDTFTTALREVASVMLPLAEQLAPIFSDITGTLLEVFKPLLDLAGAIAQALLPVIKFLADAFAGFAPVIRAVTAILAGLFAAITAFLSSLFGNGNTGDVMADFKKSMVELSKHLIMLSAYIAKLFGGGEDFISGMIKSLEGRSSEKKDATGNAAAQNASFVSFTEFSKQVALQASVAQGEPKKKTQEDLFGDLTNQLKAMQTNGDKTLDRVITAITNAATKIVSSVLTVSLTKFVDTYTMAAKEAGRKGKAAVQDAIDTVRYGPVVSEELRSVTP